ncbi:MAG: hypothetical protein TQ37_06320 [Candidatus Synechococcus spongiarum 15L]|uniref:Transposase DDE domain-containing protein n=2 Tax=Candidatus Synechococcus spongiarum TaxID=431041 RepID=A0A1T1D744_9SYNE|nr:MAG: hypothetical protein TQ37_06320 [Candidatus Synechococcus spongiarum 15L]OOV36630.1 hypothetical protein BV53_00060 [Candidatus Synechococcus spongiarum LMB bulk15N]
MWVAIAESILAKIETLDDFRQREWCERVKDHLRARVEQAFHIMQQQSGFDKTRLRGMGKNDSKVLILSAVTNLCILRNQVLSMQVA